ncbi:MAG TPA: YbhN family protein [Acidimicrobiales bacterium]|nr:YbhN family protein [Acidimicrobiales bacterium]
MIVFLFAFYIALPLLASHRSEVESLGHIRFQFVILGLLLQVGALAAYTELTRTVLPAGQLSRFRVFRINLSTLALNHVSPGGGAPGAALWYRLATQSGVSSGDSGFALATQGIGSAVVLNALFWLSLVVFLVIHGFHPPTGHTGGASVSVSILVTVAAALGVIVMTAFGGIFYLLTRGQDRAKALVRRIAVRLRFRHPDRIAESVEGIANRFALLVENKPLLYRALVWATANWLLDAASLWVFVGAFSHFISPVDLMVAYGLANVLAAIPITPGGLGIVEFVLVSMITSFGPTADQALSAVLAYRAVNFWLPIPFGGLAYASLEFERGTLYRRLHLFFLHRYQLRRPTDPADEGASPAANGRVAPPASSSASPPSSSNGTSGSGGDPQGRAPEGRAPEAAETRPSGDPDPVQGSFPVDGEPGNY